MSDAVITPAQDSEESTNWRSIPQMAVLFGLVLCLYGSTGQTAVCFFLPHCIHVFSEPWIRFIIYGFGSPSF